MSDKPTVNYDQIKHEAKTQQEYNQIKEAKDMDAEARAKFRERLRAEGHDTLQTEKIMRQKGYIL